MAGSGLVLLVNLLNGGLNVLITVASKTSREQSLSSLGLEAASYQKVIMLAEHKIETVNQEEIAGNDLQNIISHVASTYNLFYRSSEQIICTLCLWKEALVLFTFLQKQKICFTRVKYCAS